MCRWLCRWACRGLCRGLCRGVCHAEAAGAVPFSSWAGRLQHSGANGVGCAGTRAQFGGYTQAVADGRGMCGGRWLAVSGARLFARAAVSGARGLWRRGAAPDVTPTLTLAALPPLAALPRYPKTHRPIFITRPPEAVAMRPARAAAQCVPPPSLPARPQP